MHIPRQSYLCWVCVSSFWPLGVVLSGAFEQLICAFARLNDKVFVRLHAWVDWYILRCYTSILATYKHSKRLVTAGYEPEPSPEPVWRLCRRGAYACVVRMEPEPRTQLSLRHTLCRRFVGVDPSYCVDLALIDLVSHIYQKCVVICGCVCRRVSIIKRLVARSGSVVLIRAKHPNVAAHLYALEPRFDAND